jgi:hypothetical protein
VWRKIVWCPIALHVVFPEYLTHSVFWFYGCLVSLFSFAVLSCAATRHSFVLGSKVFVEVCDPGLEIWMHRSSRLSTLNTKPSSDYAQFHRKNSARPPTKLFIVVFLCLYCSDLGGCACKGKKECADPGWSSRAAVGRVGCCNHKRRVVDLSVPISWSFPGTNFN